MQVQRPGSPPRRIVTERLVLRCYTADDAPALKAAIDANLDHLRAWMPWAMDEPTPVDQLGERLARFHDAFDAGTEWPYAIFDSSERELLGSTGLHRRGDAHVLEIGFWIRADRQGHGYVTEAARALTRVAATVDGVARVEIHCDPSNTRSAAVAARLGYRHVRTGSGDRETAQGETRDTMIWELTAAEAARLA